MTLSQLYTAALQRLQVLAAGEGPSAEDGALVAAKYAALYDMLLTKGLVAWTATDDIPLYAEIPLTSMLACVCAREFNAPPLMVQELMAEGGLDMPQPSLAERQLRAQLAKQYVSYPAQSDYF